MTDEQIIKALECCADDSVIRCEECLYGVSIFTCMQMQLKKDSLDLINRQKAEIERLNKELKETTEKFNCHQYVYADLSDIIREKNAEIEKLQSDNSSMQSTLAKMSMGVEEAKAEVIKEFADMLITEKTTAISCDLFEEVVRKSDIDNLVKEKAGD